MLFMFYMFYKNISYIEKQSNKPTIAAEIYKSVAGNAFSLPFLPLLQHHCEAWSFTEFGKLVQDFPSSKAWPTRDPEQKTLKKAAKPEKKKKKLPLLLSNDLS